MQTTVELKKLWKSEVKRDDDKNCATKEEQGTGTMIAPGIRVVRGPDWIWQNQGKRREREKGRK